MRISYPQFCAKGTAAFIAIFSLARRKSSSVFLRVSHSDLPHCIVYIADGIWLCADRVCVLPRPVFSRGCAGISFMPCSARARACPALSSLFHKKGGITCRRRGRQAEQTGRKCRQVRLFGPRRTGKRYFSGAFIRMRLEASSFFMMRPSKGRARVFFRRPMSEKSKNLPTMLITCPFFICVFEKNCAAAQKRTLFAPCKCLRLWILWIKYALL